MGKHSAYKLPGPAGIYPSRNLENHLVQAIRTAIPWRRMPSVVPKVQAPGVNIPPHGLIDIRTQAHSGAEHRLGARFVRRTIKSWGIFTAAPKEIGGMPG